MSIVIDNFLISNIESLVKGIPDKDRRILTSLVRQLNSNVFFTENQASLVLKIFKENNIMLDVEAEWSKPFRKISQVRKIFIDKDEQSIVVEFTFSKRIKAIMAELAKKADGSPKSSLKRHSFDLTEHNIYLVLTALKNDKFDIDDTLQGFFQEISAIKEENFDPYHIDNISQSLRSEIENEVMSNDLLLIADRRIKYQIRTTSPAHPSSLTELIAARTGSKISVNSETVNLSKLFQSLIELHRFPILLVFNPHDASESLTSLNALISAREATMPNASCGVYFRFESADPNSPQNEFNRLIKEHQLNSKLDSNTKIVVVSNNHLPKFMIKNDWYPRTVISFINNFKANKTSVYCDEVDLIIYYNKVAPIGIIDEIV